MKLCVATIGACAGLAVASQGIVSPEAFGNDSTMPAGAFATMTIDLSGVESYGWAGDPNNYYNAFGFDPNTHIVGIGWDLTIETAGPSWMSEVTIEIYNTSFNGGVTTNPGWNSAYPGTEFFSSNGIISLIGNGDFLLGSDGLLHMDIFETWDDNDNATDATFLAGSRFYVQYVPAPSGLSLAGLVALFGTKRRR